MKNAWAIGGLVCLIAGPAMAQAGEPAPPENRYSAVQAQRQAEPLRASAAEMAPHG